MARLTLPKLKRHLCGATEILRGQIDTTRYKDIILGMLLLKRCSDVFEEEQDRLIKNNMKGGLTPEEAIRAAENPDAYKGIFVPRQSRFAYLDTQLDKNISKGLNRALKLLSKCNPTLSGLLDHIDFTKKIGHQSLSENKLRSLIKHFNLYRMRNSDFEHSDLLGSAYEYMVNQFAESGGKKGGEFYTPRSVVKLMVSLLKPQQEMNIYDPCCGSGGMLLYSKQYVEDHGGNGQSLKLYGQDNEGSAWIVCNINLILHGASHFDIVHDDVLLNPSHINKGELRQFDRILSNPPFSMKYDKNTLLHLERFSGYGDISEMGKRSDFLFALHMLASLAPKGIMATIMPHGVLYRRGYEVKIRKKLVDQDSIEAIIGLAGNLFFGTNLPACIMIMRKSGEKPINRQGHILFINADRKFEPGRTHNHLKPEHVEKIKAAYEQNKDIPYFSRKVSLEEIEREGYSLNIRRYIDSSPPIERQDVTAHLVGGIPKTEVLGLERFCQAQGFDLSRLFCCRNREYYDFIPTITSKDAICNLIETSQGVQKKENSLYTALERWWFGSKQQLAKLSENLNIMELRRGFIATFIDHMHPIGIFDHYEIIGILALWLDETDDELKTINKRGFSELFDGWINIIEDCIKNVESGRKVLFDPFDHKLVRKMLPDYLIDINQCKTTISRLESKREQIEQQEWDDINYRVEEGDTLNFIDYIKSEMRELKTKMKETHQQIQSLIRGSNVSDGRSIAAFIKQGKSTCDMEANLSNLKKSYAINETLLSEYTTLLNPWNELNDRIADERLKFRTLSKQLINRLYEAKQSLNYNEMIQMVQEMALDDIRKIVEISVFRRRQELKSALVNLFKKYSQSLYEIETHRAETANRFSLYMKELKYV